MSPAPGAEVLVVCTGNICRSPAAERLLASRLSTADVHVGSAGTRALVGRPMDSETAALVRAAGAPVEDFAARALHRDLVGRADLVLVMTRAHRSAVVAAAPAAVRRTFLLTELALLAERVAAAGWPADLDPSPAARLAALPGLVAPHRAGLPGTDPDVVDPFRLGPEVHRQAVAVIAGAVDRLVAAVR